MKMCCCLNLVSEGQSATLTISSISSTTFGAEGDRQSAKQTRRSICSTNLIKLFEKLFVFFISYFGGCSSKHFFQKKILIEGHVISLSLSLTLSPSLTLSHFALSLYPSPSLPMLPYKLFLSLLNFSSASLHSPLSLFPSLTSHLSLSHSHIHLRHINHFSLINIYPFLPMQEYSFWLFNILITSRTINLILLLTLPDQTYFHEKKSNEINVYIQCNFISIKKRLYFKTLKSYNL